MSEVYNDAASRLWWGVRRYAWIFLAIVPITSGIALLAVRGAAPVQRTYRASALVIATQREFPPELFARLASTVFSGGTVSERAVSEGRLPIDPKDLIPKYASLEPVQDNIITRVIGEHGDPELAARIANSAATALVEELNRSGLGVGQFAVQDHARVPTAPDTSTSRALPIIVGMLAGFLLGGGIIGLILSIRRPLLGAGEAAELAGAPILGTPTLPPLRAGRLVEAETVKGLSALAKRIMPSRPGIVVLASCGGDERLRTLLAQLVSTVLGERGAVFLIPSADRVSIPLYDQFAAPSNVVVTERLPDGKVWRMAAVVVDGPSARRVDIPQALPTQAGTVLIVLQGTPLTRVRDAAEQFLPGELEGVIFVRRSTWWPWFRSPAAVAQSTKAPESLEAWAAPQAKPSWSPEERQEIRLDQSGMPIERETPVSREGVRTE